MTVQIPTQTDSPAQPRPTFWDLAGFDGGDRFNSPKSASNGSSVSFPTWESVETDLPNEDAIPVKKFPRLAEMISDIWSDHRSPIRYNRVLAISDVSALPSPFLAGFD